MRRAAALATRLTFSLDDGDVRAVVADQLATGLTTSAVPTRSSCVR